MDEMELFLVRATIGRTEYMDDESRFEDIRLVKASDYSEAEEKYYSYWENKGSLYSTSYRVVEFDAQETIG